MFESVCSIIHVILLILSILFHFSLLSNTFRFSYSFFAFTSFSLYISILEEYLSKFNSFNKDNDCIKDSTVSLSIITMLLIYSWIF